MDNKGGSETETLGSQMDALSLQRSLVKTLFDADFKRLSDEEMSSLVKDLIKKTVCQQALTLKREIEQDMNLEEEETQMKGCLENLKILQNILIDVKRKEVESPPIGNEQYNNYAEYVRKLERTKSTTMKNINTIMDHVSKVEDRMSKLKFAWELFRENYKDEVFKFLNHKLRNENDFPSFGSAISWTNFLPTIGTPNIEGVEEDVHMNYYE